MKSTTLVLFCLLMTAILCQKQQAVFALSWLSGFCEYDGGCSDTALARWDHQSFTIHGLWPQTVSSKFFGSLNPQRLDRKLRNEMLNFWPPQNRDRGDKYFLWNHEWNKHGKDYSAIMLNLAPNNFSTLYDDRNFQLQTKYLNDAINLYKSLKLQKIPKDSYSKSDFATYLGINNMAFYPVCNKGTGTLQELRICVSIGNDGIKPIKCSRMASRNCQSGFKIILGDWQQSASGRAVTVY